MYDIDISSGFASACTCLFANLPQLMFLKSMQGAEAIFLHLIHPLLRPYVPAIDEVTMVISSVFELFVLILYLPLEYLLFAWNRCTLAWTSWRSASNTGNPDVHEGLGSGSDNDSVDLTDQRLRPRKELDRAKLTEAQRLVLPILQDVDDAQERVRNRTRAQQAAQSQSSSQPSQGTRDNAISTAPLRTRRRILAQGSQSMHYAALPLGSKSTVVHHLTSGGVAQLAREAPTKVLANQPLGTSVGHEGHWMMNSPASRPSKQPEHQIWYPPLSSFEQQHSTPPPPYHIPSRTPSPVYPAFPAAYPFTPRLRTASLKDAPRAPTLPDIPTVVVGTSQELIDPSEFTIDEPRADPSMPRMSLSQESRASENLILEDFFQPALDPSIQATVSMDMDIEPQSKGDGSSAKQQSTDPENGLDITLLSPQDADDSTPRKRRKRTATSIRNRRGRNPATESPKPLRRSTRREHDSATNVERDVFGFTIRDDLDSVDTSTIGSTSTSRSTTPSMRKKTLARTKPELKPTHGEDFIFQTSDEESIKKKRKVKPSDTLIEDDGTLKRRIKQTDDPESEQRNVRGNVVISGPRNKKSHRGLTAKTNESTVTMKEKPQTVTTRTTRAGKRQGVQGEPKRR